MSHILIKYFLTFFFFIIIDLLWLGIIARSIYVHYLGTFLRTPPHWPVAFLFYGLFVLGLLYYAVYPSIQSNQLSTALYQGALFGFFTYLPFISNLFIFRTKFLFNSISI